jgi:glycosyltransferase involved in cell wall biosynthesis
LFAGFTRIQTAIDTAADAGTELAEFLANAAIVVPAGDPAAMAEALLDVLDGRHVDQCLGARLALAAQLDRRVLLEHFHNLIRRSAFKEISVQTTPVTPY